MLTIGRVKSRCLEPHKLTHSQDRPYKCDICKKCFKTPSTLYQHQKVHATDSKAHKYLCEYCGKRYVHTLSFHRKSVMHRNVKLIITFFPGSNTTPAGTCMSSGSMKENTSMNAQFVIRGSINYSN